MEWNNENSRENECNYKINKNFKSNNKNFISWIEKWKRDKKRDCYEYDCEYFRFRKCGYTTRDKGNEIYAKNKFE